MKIKTNKNSKYNLPLIIAVSAVVLALSLLYFYLSYGRGATSPSSVQGETPTVNLDKPTPEQINAGNDSKKQAVEKDLESQSQATEHKTTTLTITSSNVSAGILHIRAFIQDVVSDGTCSLVMTNKTTAARVTQTADTQALPDGSACKGFDVDLAQLSDSTTWNIQLSYSGTKYSGETTKDITVNQ